jgi:hypothetical protein
VNESEYEKLLDEVAGFEKWLDDKEGQQAKRALTEDPAFACADVDAKATELLKKVGLPGDHRFEDSRDHFKLHLLRDCHVVGDVTGREGRRKQSD